MGTMYRPMAEFLASIADSLPSVPASILVVTAHWEAPVSTLSGGASPELIYDYGGFPPETYTLTYPAPASPGLAVRASALLNDADITNEIDLEHGWDHGVFIPLKVMFPDAEIPVVAMSLRSDLDPVAHMEIGRALAPLRDEGVLIVGSGMSYHNMSRIVNGAEISIEFDTWLDSALSGDSSDRFDQLSRWTNAPSGRAAHPREEHLIPLMVASGAGSDEPGTKIWQGEAGSSRFSSWAFD